MRREEKVQTIQTLQQEFEEANSLLVCDYKGLSVAKLEELRNKARSLGIKVQVIKNKLASIALREAGYPELELKGTNIYIWAQDQISVSKVVCKFASENEENFALKFGYFDSVVVDKNHIITMSKLPSKEELIGMLLSVWSAPARYFVTGLDNLRKQKEAR